MIESRGRMWTGQYLWHNRGIAESEFYRFPHSMASSVVLLTFSMHNRANNGTSRWLECLIKSKFAATCPDLILRLITRAVTVLFIISTWCAVDD